jgi:hypothetical protein
MSDRNLRNITRIFHEFKTALGSQCRCYVVTRQGRGKYAHMGTLVARYAEIYNGTATVKRVDLRSPVPELCERVVNDFESQPQLPL